MANVTRTVITTLALSILAANSASAIDWTEGEHGEVAVIPMGYAPFPHVSRVTGHQYKETVYPYEGHYDDPSVLLLIPKGYEPGEKTDLLFYWHGWGNTIQGSMKNFDLAGQVARSGRNVILVFPEGPKMASDSTCGKMEDEGGLARLADEVLANLRRDKKIPAESELGSVTLSGHSGAYRAMGFSVKQGGLENHISEVILLDASYSMNEDFANWAIRKPDARLVSIYTDHLKEDNDTIMGILKENDQEFFQGMNPEVTDEMLRVNRLVFVHTQDLDHNGAVSRFESFLRSGGK